MFEGSLVESTPILQSRNRWPALISFAVQAVIVSALIAIPLMHPEIIPLTTPRMTLIAPRFTPRPPPVRLQPVRIETTSASASPSAPTQAAQLPRQAFNTDAHALDQPALAVGMNLGDAGPSPLSALTATSPTGTRVVEASPAAKPSPEIVKISTGVSAGMLISPIRPDYPAIARISRTQGTVVVQAIISKTGSIESAHAISGPEMLQPPALQAVREARYHPFFLNDQPTEVETTISIVFRLGN